MRVVFLGAYFNHHQKPLSDALAARCDYTYIATSRIPEMRLKLGYREDPAPAYVCQYDREPDRADGLLARADVIITGSAPEKLVRKCVQRNQLVLRYAERPLKNGPEPVKYLPRLVKWHWQNPRRKKVYMLCASAYTAGDYAAFGLFRGRTFRWGYFPAVKRYESIDRLMEGKEEASILWVARYLHWKHPEDALRVAARLKKEGFRFRMDLIGTGELEDTLREMIVSLELEDCVRLLGSMKPEQVREQMERSRIFLFTSDRQEGWGAVVNEAMNSGCALVASDAAGAPPYLIRDGENGVLYRSGDLDHLYEKVKWLLEQPGKASALGRRAYETMAEEWNADVAAERVLKLAEGLMDGSLRESPYRSGPCSRAGR